jgi:glycosyltransferase involved in cell wall biosynthesis
LPVAGISQDERARRTALGGNLLSFTLPWLLLREPGVDVVHSHALGRLGGAARRVAQLRRLPFVVTIHGGYLDLPPAVKQTLAGDGRGFEYGKLFGAALGARAVIPRADAVITCNPREAELLEQARAARRVVQLPHGTPVARFEPDHRVAAEQFVPGLEGKRVLLCVGRVDPVKNQRWVVEQMPEVLARHPAAVLVLAGPLMNADYERGIREFVAARGLAERVKLPGAVPPDDPRLIGLYQRADVLILPSLSETFGMVLVEAWAAHTPVLSTPTSGAKQVLREGDNGLYFELGDPASFHRGLDRLLQDPAAARAMAERGHALARAEYDLPAVARRFATFYEQLRCTT